MGAGGGGKCKHLGGWCAFVLRLRARGDLRCGDCVNVSDFTSSARFTNQGIGWGVEVGEHASTWDMVWQDLTSTVDSGWYQVVSNFTSSARFTNHLQY